MIYTVPKFWRYNIVYLGELVPLENLVDHYRDSLGEFAQTIHHCFKNKILVLWFGYNHIAVELTRPCAHERDWCGH